MSKSTPITQLPNTATQNSDKNQEQSNKNRSAIDINSIMNSNNNENNNNNDTIIPNIKISDNHNIPTVSITTTQSPHSQQMYDNNTNVHNQIYLLQEELKNIKMQNECPNGICQLKRPSPSSTVNYDNEKNYPSIISILNILNINDSDYRLFIIVLLCYFIINTDQIHSLIFNKIYDHLNNEYLILLIKSVVFTLLVLIVFKLYNK